MVAAAYVGTHAGWVHDGSGCRYGTTADNQVEETQLTYVTTYRSAWAVLSHSGAETFL